MRTLKECYSRLLIDNHITDLKAEYMRNFSAEEYLRLVKLSGVDSVMVYACDHNGNCYYPTKVGHQHANLDGKDIFGQNIQNLRKAGITPVAYYTAGYHNDCAKQLPHTRIIDNVGIDHDGRFHYTCPNQPDAVEFYKAQIREILAYDVEGFFIDMSFWPSICCCDGCRKEYGKAFPETIDWENPEWVSFQRFRENSMAEFAQKLTDFIRSVKPGLPVTHQFSPVLHGWYLGQSDGIAAASDYASGDFYGSKLQQRFAVKAFDSFTRKPPFEFMTSRCVDLHDHTTTKSPEEMFLSALTTLANGGAYFFIDAISPDGSLSERFYNDLSKVNSDLLPYKECLAATRARLTAKVGLYFSMPCCVDPKINGVKLDRFDGGRANNMGVRRNAVLDEVMGTAEILLKMHIPFKVLSESQTDYSALQAIIVNKATYMTDEQCSRLREFVRNGGTLIVTGNTSLYDLQGNGGEDFALSDVLGIHFSGNESDSITYTGKEQVLAHGNVPLVTPAADTEVRSYLTFPDFPVGDPVHYASIHSNPPGQESDYPALTVHRFGKGRCIWLAAPIFLSHFYTQQEFGKKLFSEFLPAFVAGSENLPASAEVTLLTCSDPQEYLLCIVNMQDELPVIPLHNVQLKVNFPAEVHSVTRVSDGTTVDYKYEQGILSLTIPQIHYGEFFHINKKEQI
jgi:hypothetical protein